MDITTDFHLPVLKGEVLEALNIEPGKKYIDATIGGGGHAIEIIQRGGILLGIDKDQDARSFAQKRLEQEGLKGFRIVVGSFGDIEQIGKENGFDTVGGVLFDLGVSTHQIKQSGRGFSFLGNEPLDMRMDGNKGGVTARDLVNRASYEELTEVFEKYGEENLGKFLAREIIKCRVRKRFETTRELAAVASDVYKRHGRLGKIHPATRMFQAIRIGINNELEDIKKGLTGGINLLEIHGRIAVISFHSLEDRLVKLKLQDKRLRIITKKPVSANEDEVEKNKASRSAKLRIAEKIL